METVFHDVSFAPGPKLHSKAKHVEGRSRSSLRLLTNLSLIDLSSISLHKLGIYPAQLTQTDASLYGDTRQWAVALYEQNPTAHGLKWVSRQANTAIALVLFGDRCPSSVLQILDGPTSLLQADGSASSDVLDLAARLGVRLI
jgi:hypothetical protein